MLQLIRTPRSFRPAGCRIERAGCPFHPFKCARVFSFCEHAFLSPIRQDVNKPAKKIEWVVWSGLILIIAAIAGAFVWSRTGPINLPMPVLGQIPDFNLTN